MLPPRRLPTTGPRLSTRRRTACRDSAIRLAAALALLAITGCSGGGDDTSDRAVEAECAYLDAGQLATVLGEDVEVTSATDVACAFETEDGMLVQLTKIDIQIDPLVYAGTAIEVCVPGTIVDAYVGDRSYACIGVGPIGAFYEGQVALTMGATGGSDDEATRDAFAEVMPRLTIPG